MNVHRLIAITTTVAIVLMAGTVIYADRKPVVPGPPVQGILEARVSALEERVAELEWHLNATRRRLIDHVTDADFKCHICDLPPGERDE